MRKLILVSVLLLTGCFGHKSAKDTQKEYDWAVEFCGGKKENIDSFYIYDSLPSKAYCKDGRKADIPL
ncbi:hypothetical protein key_092 [Erwinia phage KEY]|uniref:Lipoprotein n=1 Tax=Erwinia phage KEY TaxID=2821255 RepID=A0AAE8BG14_9CAUD|nr:hypothetical protein key_092 [Erwinia phage KEY]